LKVKDSGILGDEDIFSEKEFRSLSVQCSSQKGTVYLISKDNFINYGIPTLQSLQKIREHFMFKINIIQSKLSNYVKLIIINSLSIINIINRNPIS
jgi:hypothetical protein